MEPNVPVLVLTVAKVKVEPAPIIAPVPPVTVMSELVRLPKVKAICLLLKVFQSNELKYPLVVVFA